MKQNFDSTRTYGSPTPTTTTTETGTNFSNDIYGRVSDVVGARSGEDPGGTKTIWDRINSPGTQRAVRGNSSPIFPVRGSILQPTMVRCLW